MLSSTLREIKEKILKEQRNESSIEFSLIFHNGNIQKYHFSKIEKSYFTKNELMEDKDE